MERRQQTNIAQIIILLKQNIFKNIENSQRSLSTFIIIIKSINCAQSINQEFLKYFLFSEKKFENPNIDGTNKQNKKASFELTHKICNDEKAK